MFHKFNRNPFKRTMSNIKHHLGNGYHHVKNIAHHIDHGFSVAKEVYKVLEPVIKEYAGNNHHGIHGHAMKAISGYENLRNQEMEANHHISQVGHKLSGLV